MRTVIILLVVVGLSALFFVQKRHEQVAVATAKATPASVEPRKVSEHDWAKHSLDKTNNVISKVAAQRKDDGVTGR